MGHLMHVESRMVYGDVRYLLIIRSEPYKEIVECVRLLFRIMYGIEAEAGPAPPTKAERKALRVIAKLTKS